MGNTTPILKSAQPQEDAKKVTFAEPKIKVEAN